MSEKYQHTEQDFIDDKILIKEFSDYFESKFKENLDLEVYNLLEVDNLVDLKYCTESILGYGSETVYIAKTKLNPVKQLLWIETKINPNGISEGRIGRTYTIRFEPDNEKVKKFYNYSIDNFEEVTLKFEEYLQNNKII